MAEKKSGKNEFPIKKPKIQVAQNIFFLMSRDFFLSESMHLEE